MFNFFKSKHDSIGDDTLFNNNSLIAANAIIKSKYKFWKLLSVGVFFVAIMFVASKKFFLSTGAYIAKIDINSPIFTDKDILASLEKVKKDKNIKAVVFQINSPGGTITGSEMLYNAIKQISAVKPTSAFVLDISASGAYMASIATPYIVAQNTSMVGSIGVLMEYWQLEEIAKKLGAKRKTIKTSEFKAAPSIYSENSPEVEKYLNDLLIDGYDFFISLVKKERGKKITNLSEVISGKVFSGRQALNLGLIDKVGNMDDVIAFFEKNNLPNAKTLEIKNYKLKDEEKSSGLFGKFMANFAGFLIKILGFDESALKAKNSSHGIEISAM